MVLPLTGEGAAAYIPQEEINPISAPMNNTEPNPDEREGNTNGCSPLNPVSGDRHVSCYLKGIVTDCNG